MRFPTAGARTTGLRALGIAAVTALALAAAACGGGDDPDPTVSPDPAAGGTLVIWADDKRAEVLKPFGEQFQQETGVAVEVHAISDDQQNTFVTASQQNAGPDIMVGAHDWIGNLVQNGAIDPVQLSAAQRAAFPDVAINAVTFNGQLYGVPYAMENIALFRNTDLVPDAPATLEDLVEVGKGLVAAGDVEEILSLPQGQDGDVYHLYPIYTSGGGYLFGTTADGTVDPGQVGVGTPEAIEALEKIRDLGESGEGALKRSIGHENAIANFATGKTAFLVSGPWAVQDVEDGGIAYDITPVPGFAGGGTAQPFVGVQAFYVAAKGKNKAVAQEFVTSYLTQPDLAVALYQAEPRPPALTAALEQVSAEDPNLAKFIEAGANGTPMPAIPEMNAIWGPLGNAQSAVIGGADPETAAKAAADAITEQISG